MAEKFDYYKFLTDSCKSLIQITDVLTERPKVQMRFGSVKGIYAKAIHTLATDFLPPMERRDLLALFDGIYGVAWSLYCLSPCALPMDSALSLCPQILLKILSQLPTRKRSYQGILEETLQLTHTAEQCILKELPALTPCAEGYLACAKILRQAVINNL